MGKPWKARSNRTNTVSTRYVVGRSEKKGGTRAGLREIGRGKGRRVRWPPTDDGGHGARATDLEVVARYRAHY